MDNNVVEMKKSIICKILSFSQLPQNVDKIPNSRGPGTHPKMCCDGPDTIFSSFLFTCIVMEQYSARARQEELSRGNPSSTTTL